jgi:hypothetical protein
MAGDVPGGSMAVGRLHRVDPELEDPAASQDLRGDQPLAERIVRAAVPRLARAAVRGAHAGTASDASVAMSGTTRS